MPRPPIRTARLTLRVGKPEDAPALVAAMATRDVVGELSRVPWPYTLDDAQSFIAGMERDGLPRFLVFRTDGNEESLVGGCGVTRGGDLLKIGYWTAKEAWGNGIASEAVAAMLETMRVESFETVYAEHKTGNIASARVLEKLGFSVWEDAPAEIKSHPALVLRVKHL